MAAEISASNFHTATAPPYGGYLPIAQVPFYIRATGLVKLAAQFFRKWSKFESIDTRDIYDAVLQLGTGVTAFFVKLFPDHASSAYVSLEK